MTPTRIVAFSLLFLLAGCADAPSGEDGTGAKDADPTVPDGEAAGAGDGNFTAETFVHRSTLEAAVRVPPVVGPPVEVEQDDAPLSLTVPDDVDVLLLELVWSDRIDGVDRGELSLRTIDQDDRYVYGGGQAGTREDPVTLWLENPVASYDVSPVASELTAQQDYEIHVTYLRGDVPETYTAFAEDDGVM